MSKRSMYVIWGGGGGWLNHLHGKVLHTHEKFYIQIRTSIHRREILHTNDTLYFSHLHGKFCWTGNHSPEKRGIASYMYLHVLCWVYVRIFILYRLNYEHQTTLPMQSNQHTTITKAQIVLTMKLQTTLPSLGEILTSTLQLQKHRPKPLQENKTLWDCNR